MALAVSNKFIHLLQVLLKRTIHRRSSGKVHVSKIDFLMIQNLGSLREGNLRGGSSRNRTWLQGDIRFLPQLQKSSSNDYQAHGRCCQSAATKQLAEAMPPGRAFTAERNDWRLDNFFKFKLGAKRIPHARGRFDFGGQFICDRNNPREVGDKFLAITASSHMRSGGFRQRRQTCLLHYEFHVLTLHNTSLRGSGRWMPPPSDFSQNRIGVLCLRSSL